MAETYKLKNTDNLDLFQIPVGYIPVTRAMAEKLSSEDKPIYALYYRAGADSCITSTVINDLDEEPNTQLFVQRLVTPSDLNDWFYLKQELDKIQSKIDKIEDNFMKDVEIAGTDLAVSCNKGVMFSCERVKVTCTKPNFIKELLGKDCEISPKPVTYDVPKAVNALAVAINEDDFSEYQSVEEMLKGLCSECFKSDEEITNFTKRLRKSEKANINLFMNKLNLSNEEALACIAELRKVNNTIELNKWYKSSKATCSLEEFKDNILCGFQFQANTVISTKTV